MDASGSMVMISAERLRELEKVESKKRERLLKLKEYQKLHTDKHNKRTLEAYHQNKDEINAKRRERYKAKKEAELEAAAKAAQAAS